MLLALLLVALAPPLPPPACVAPDGTRISLELALTDQEKGLGLMFRDSLPPTSGMLFVFERDDTHRFYMKNTFIPLDMVWLDASGEVVEVKPDVPPCHSNPCPTYEPKRPARVVLEVNAGFCARHGIKPGVLLVFENVPHFPAAAGPR